MEGKTLTQEDQQRIIFIHVPKEVPYAFAVTNVILSTQTGPHTACPLKIFVHEARQKKELLLSN